MQDVTEIFDHFREAARSVWNTAFRPVPELRSWDAQGRFEIVKERLFEALVLLRTGDYGCCEDLSKAPRPAFCVVPDLSDTLPILIHKPREGDRNRYWDDPVTSVRRGEVELRFLDYFDWDILDYVDFEYYRVRVEAFPAQPHLVGREALVKRSYAKVMIGASPGEPVQLPIFDAG
jgi:hypothetical protein